MEFLPGSEHIAHSVLTNPKGMEIAYEGELFLAYGGNIYTTSGLVPFTIPADSSLAVDFPIVMPAAGTYQVCLFIYVAGQQIAAYIASENVTITEPTPIVLPNDAIEALPLYCSWYGRKADSCSDKVVDYYSVPDFFELMGVTHYCKQSREPSYEADIAESGGSCDQSKAIEGCGGVDCGRVTHRIPSIEGGKAVIILRNQPTDDWTAYLHIPTIKEPYSFIQRAEVSGSGNIIRFENVPSPPDHYKHSMFLTISFTNGEVWCRPGALCVSSAVTPEHRLGWEEYYYKCAVEEVDCARRVVLEYAVYNVPCPTISSGLLDCIGSKATKLGFPRGTSYRGGSRRVEQGLPCIIAFGPDRIVPTGGMVNSYYNTKLQELNAAWYEYRNEMLQLQAEFDANWDYGGDGSQGLRGR